MQRLAPMSTKYGICPTCGLDKRLTDKRGVMASHVVQGAKCPGSGSVPSSVTRFARNTSPPRAKLLVAVPDALPGDREWVGRCRECRRDPLTVDHVTGLLASHSSSQGKPCSGKGTEPVGGSVRPKIDHSVATKVDSQRTDLETRADVQDTTPGDPKFEIRWPDFFSLL